MASANKSFPKAKSELLTSHSSGADATISKTFSGHHYKKSIKEVSVKYQDKN